MLHLIQEERERYHTGILIKESAFSASNLQAFYINPLKEVGIDTGGIISLSLDYNKAGKCPIKLIRKYLEDRMPSIVAAGIQTLYVADAAYFKELTKSKQAEALLGYLVPCVWPGAEHIKIVMGVNYQSLVYNDQNQGKLDRSIDAIKNLFNGVYIEPGKDVIETAIYPKTTDEIEQLLLTLHQYPRLSLDIEAFSLKHYEAGIGTVTLCWSKSSGCAFPVDYSPFAAKSSDGFYGEKVPNHRRRMHLYNFLLEYTGTIVYHNAAYDAKVLVFVLFMQECHTNYEGMITGCRHLTKNFEDTKLTAYLTQNACSGNKLSLKDQAAEYMGNWAEEEINDIRKIPLDTLLKYNLKDGLATQYLIERDLVRLVEEDQMELYQGLFKESVTSLLAVELTGMPLDMDQVAAARVELDGIVTSACERLSKMGSVEHLTSLLRVTTMQAANDKLKVKQHPLSHFDSVCYNPNSGNQNQRLLYEVMRLPVIDKTKSGAPATGAKTLTKLKEHTNDPESLEILSLLIDYHKANKVLTSFIPAFEKAIPHNDGTEVMWLHGSFNLGGTKSGRLSSSKPNLQNIPAGSTFAKLIKKCFTAPKGKLMGGADFNSLEDYISSLTTKDPNKLKVYSGLKQYDVTINGEVHRINEETIIEFDREEITGEALYERLQNS